MPHQFSCLIYLILCFYESLAEGLDSQKTVLKELDWSVWCKFQPNGNDCNDKGIVSGRYYYDTKLEGCRTFLYGQCPTSFNNFDKQSDCFETCREDGLHAIKQNLSANAYCRLQPDFGACNEYHPMYYFDVNKRLCVGFSYSGCGGNLNRFANAQVCAAVCSTDFEF